jgi:YidC/Oxa1 family membrane protein insertase
MLVSDVLENLTDEPIALVIGRCTRGKWSCRKRAPGCAACHIWGWISFRKMGGASGIQGKSCAVISAYAAVVVRRICALCPWSPKALTRRPQYGRPSRISFFVQIVEPDTGIRSVAVQADRADRDAFVVSSVRAALALPSTVLGAGDRLETGIRYYAGPKKYTLLRDAGNQRADVMEFGRFFKWICQLLLPLLNVIESVLPGGYGVAVILLTIIVKLVFWPVTHKGTESMKRMQALQPELKKLREKYKSDPKKLQEKQMLLYREHKVNPLAGCLPMVIQIPVFIGLFTVLRSAVELRYARFLWIADLSEPEGLFAGAIPFLSSGVNILPLLMTATMVLQQRLTPSAGDPQQQKMMAFMPIMMLFLFYGMPSGLVLYWTVSQALSILQLYLQRQRDGVGSMTPAVA